jgi:hypothetical protein
MSNTKTAKKAAEQQPDAEETRAAQDAQVAEANGTARTFTFDGYEYEILENQPSWKALDYVSQYAVDNNNMAMVPAIKEIIGPDQWHLAAQRHRGDQISDFWVELNKAAGGN